MAVVAALPFQSYQPAPGAPYQHAVLITPSDTDDLANASTAVLISVDGALKVDTEGGETVTFPTGTFLVKTFLPLRVRRIYSTGTTATGIIAFR
jgi:hypothetical protein